MMLLPAPVPEIPAANVDTASAYYVNVLGFTLDWGGDEGGIGYVSKDDCRLFLTNRSFRETHDNVAPPEDKPWNLREFTAADLDGNRIRVFYDFSRDL